MVLSNARIFLYCLISFILSIAVASFFPSQLIQNDFILFLGLVFVFVLLVLFTVNKKQLTVYLMLFSVFLGFWRYSLSIPQKTSDNIWFYNEKTIFFSGMIVDEPDKRARSQKLKIKTSEVYLDGKKQRVHGNVLVSVDGFLDFEYGDDLKLHCKLKTPEEFEGFSYDRYLARFDIFSVCYYPKIEKNLKNKSFHLRIFFYKKIFFIKNKIRKIINSGLSEPEAGLGRAIIIGDKKGIPDDLRINFSRAGLSHIVAISGMHISIISAMVMGGLLYVGVKRKNAFCLASIFLFVYVLIIGLPPSAMRAGMMGFLVLWALHLGRLNKLTNSLFLSAVILLLINPRLFRDDIGFQLSFLAVLGIAFINPLLKDIFDHFKVPNLRGVREIFLLTISAQVFTLPVIAMNFGTISLIAPVANLLVLWTLPFLMVAMIGGILLGGFFSNLSLVWFLPAKIILNFIVYVSGLMTSLPFSYFYQEKISIIFVSFYYLFCFVIICYYKYRMKEV